MTSSVVLVDRQWALAVIVREARWASGETELRVATGEPSAAYLAWVVAQRAGEDGPETYDYDEGVAP